MGNLIKLYHRLGAHYSFLEKRVVKEAVAYSAIGAIGAVIDFASFYFFLTRGLGVAVSQWLAAFLGFSNNHLWQHFWIFDHNRHLQVTYPFSLVVSFFAILASAPVLIAIDSVVGNIWVSKLIVGAVTAVFLFSVRKFFIFVKK